MRLKLQTERCRSKIQALWIRAQKPSFFGPPPFILVLFLVLALTYNIVTPIGEADNELSHFRYIQYIHNHGRLPPTDYEPPPPPAHCSLPAPPPKRQFRQPPLYYVLNAIAFFWRDMSDTWWPDANLYGWHALNTDGGRNVYLHSSAERFPYTGVVLTVRMIRLFSTLIGLVGLIAVWRTASLLFLEDERLAQSMTALVALNPAYLFAGATINNDILVATLGLWAVYFALRSVLAAQPGRSLVGMTICFALAVVTKYSAFLFAPFLALAFLFVGGRFVRQREKPIGHYLLRGVPFVVVGLTPALWWFWRNWVRQGAIVPGYSKTLASLSYKVGLLVNMPVPELANTIAEGVRFTFITYWGLLGADALVLPDTVTTVLGLLCIGAVAGLVWRLVRRQGARWEGAIVGLAVSGIGLAWIEGFLAGFYAPRGRYLLALYGLMAFLLVRGASTLRLPRHTWSLTHVLVGLAFMVAVYAPLGVIRPTYLPPNTQQAAVPAAGEMPTFATFDNLAELVSVDVQPRDVAPGEEVRVTLRWRVLNHTPNNYVVGVHLSGADGSYLGGTAHWPANGRYPTSLWRPGDVFLDTYRFSVREGLRSRLPMAARARVSVYCQSPEGDRELGVRDVQGRESGTAVFSAPIRVGPKVKPASPPARLLATFGDEIGLLAVAGVPKTPLEAGANTRLRMAWVALKRPTRDYTVFVQVLDENNRVRLAADHPLTNNYYPSSLWRPGERVVHEHVINLAGLRRLPKGTYRLVMGLYHVGSGKRLPIEGGERVSSEGYVLAEWRVGPLTRGFVPFLNVAEQNASGREKP